MPYSNNFPKYLYECYLCFALLCIFYGNCAICYVVDTCMSVCTFGVVIHTLYEFVENAIVIRTRGGRVVYIARKTLSILYAHILNTW